MNKNSKGVIIDIIILIIYGFLLMFGIYVLYDIFPTLSRLIAMLIIFVNIPIVWGTAILSFMGKKTIGHRLTDKKLTNIIKVLILILVIFIIIFLIYQNFRNSDIKEINMETGADFSNCKKIKTYNTKGAFGDGDYVVILDCSINNNKIIKQINSWDKCPLEDDIYNNVYGNEDKGYAEYERISTKYNIPKIKQCYYQFLDTNSNSKELDGFPKNFILSIYDIKTKKLYYIDYDS
jgi:hypothetical protein